MSEISNRHRTKTLDYELRTGKGHTWGLAIGAVIGGYSAYKQNRNQSKARRDAKELEKKRQNKEARLAREDRELQQRGAQLSQGLTSTSPKNNEASIFSPTILGVAVIGIAIIAMARK
jgi:hypothetical protein